MAQRYLIALGSNRRHGRFGPPERVLQAALGELAGRKITIEAKGPVLPSAPLGPSLRRYANSAAVIKTGLGPEALLGVLQAAERKFGRRRGGQRWGARVLDLDIVLWSGGMWASPGLLIPHPQFRQRAFVLTPALAVGAKWRDPVTGLTLRQLRTRLLRPTPSGA